MKYGSHVSFTKPNYLVGAVEASLGNNANAMMIYLGGPQSSLRIPTTQYKIDEYQEKYSKFISPENIVVHAPYIVNPASVSKGEFAVEFLIQEINRMNTFGAKYLVLHPGAFVGFTYEEAMQELVKNLKKILSATKNVEILLETMSGKGTELGSKFEDLKIIIDAVNSERIGVCFDTCHTWDAGYDLRDHQNIISKLKALSLVEKIKVIHVNDSKNDLGSHKDRHENIDKGFIGLKTIKKFIALPEFHNTIQILETPYVDDKPIYDEEIKMLWL